MQKHKAELPLLKDLQEGLADVTGASKENITLHLAGRVVWLLVKEGGIDSFKYQQVLDANAMQSVTNRN